MTLEMAVAPIALAMANHPDLESLRPLVAALHHVGRHTGHGQRGRARDRAHRRPLAARLRHQRGARHRRQPGRRAGQAGASTPPGSPSAASRCASSTSTRGAVLEPGGVGEIQVQSASAMAGYLPDEATAAAFDDGWYRTGDVGWLEPEGWVHLTDRCKEMIKVSGFQVAPAEIEAVLHGHPAVVDCAVFGVPDERAGEVPVAAVQLEPGSAVTAADLERLVADTLATYKRLHHVVLVDAIPRTPSGKVLRRTLRDEWAPTFAAGGGRLMDVRLSPEQAALRDCRDAGRRPSGRPRRRRARRPRACRQARRGGRSRRAGANCGRRPTTGPRGPRRSRSRSSPRSSAGAWPTPPSSARPWRPSSAAAPGHPTATGPRRSRCAPTSASRRRPRVGGARGRRRARRVRRHGRPWCSSAGRPGTRSARWRSSRPPAAST